MKKEITHSDNEFLITIPRKSNQVTNQESIESNQKGHIRLKTVTKNKKK